MKKKIVIFLSILIILMMACSLPSINTGNDGEDSDDGVVVEKEIDEEGGDDGVVDEDDTDPPDLLPKGPPTEPISINEGLASLNSYQLLYSINLVGPTPNQKSSYMVESQRAIDSDASSTHILSSSVAVDGTASNSDTYTYRIGNDQCSGSEDGWTWTSLSPAERELKDLSYRLINITPLIENPVFVGEETINGIQTNHFSFSMSGLGVKSGAEVRINQGDYWLAIDGQYLVKYLLIVETSMTADTEIMHEEVSLELTQINQPVNITFSQACMDASLVSPEP